MDSSRSTPLRVGLLPLFQDRGGAVTFRVYLRWPGGKVSHKTTTEVEAVAQFAFEQLLGMQDLYGKEVAASMTRDNQNVRYHEFNTRETGPR